MKRPTFDPDRSASQTSSNLVGRYDAIPILRGGKLTIAHYFVRAACRFGFPHEGISLDKSCCGEAGKETASSIKAFGFDQFDGPVGKDQVVA